MLAVVLVQRLEGRSGGTGETQPVPRDETVQVLARAQELVADARHAMDPGGDGPNAEALDKVLSERAAIPAQDVVRVALVLHGEPQQDCHDPIQGHNGAREVAGFSKVMLGMTPRLAATDSRALLHITEGPFATSHLHPSVKKSAEAERREWMGEDVVYRLHALVFGDVVDVQPNR